MNSLFCKYQLSYRNDNISVLLFASNTLFLLFLISLSKLQDGILRSIGGACGSFK